jgi:hypothetical protein
MAIRAVDIGTVAQERGVLINPNGLAAGHRKVSPPVFHRRGRGYLPARENAMQLASLRENNQCVIIEMILKVYLPTKPKALFYAKQFTHLVQYILLCESH